MTRAEWWRRAVTYQITRTTNSQAMRTALAARETISQGWCRLLRLRQFAIRVNHGLATTPLENLNGLQ
jgi:hypothetical protein